MNVVILDDVCFLSAAWQHPFITTWPIYAPAKALPVKVAI